MEYFATNEQKKVLHSKNKAKKSAQKEIVVIHLIPSHLKIDFILLFCWCCCCFCFCCFYIVHCYVSCARYCPDNENRTKIVNEVLLPIRIVCQIFSLCSSRLLLLVRLRPPSFLQHVILVIYCIFLPFGEIHTEKRICCFCWWVLRNWWRSC